MEQAAENVHCSIRVVVVAKAKRTIQPGVIEKDVRGPGVTAKFTPATFIPLLSGARGCSGLEWIKSSHF